MHVISILALVLKKTQWWMFHRRLFGLTYSFFVWIRLPLYRLGIARTGSVLAAPSFRFPPSSVFFWFPLSAILFLKYKSVKSGEEVAGGGREIQSVMKNFYVLRYRVYFSTFRLLRCRERCRRHCGRPDRDEIRPVRYYGLLWGCEEPIKTESLPFTVCRTLHHNIRYGQAQKCNTRNRVQWHQYRRVRVEKDSLRRWGRFRFLRWQCNRRSCRTLCLPSDLSVHSHTHIRARCIPCREYDGLVGPHSGIFRLYPPERPERGWVCQVPRTALYLRGVPCIPKGKEGVVSWFVGFCTANIVTPWLNFQIFYVRFCWGLKKSEGQSVQFCCDGW